MDVLANRKFWMGLVLSLCASLLLMTYAKAADKGGPKPAPQQDVLADLPVAKLSWTSVYIGGFVGYGAADGVLSGGVISPLSVDGLSATGRVAGVTVGADWQLPSSFLVLGARASYSWSDENFTVGPGLLKAGIRDGWSADGRVGAAFGTALPYVGLGFTTVHTAASGLVVSPTYSSADLHGIRYIVGVEYRLPKVDMGSVFTPTIALEVVYTDFDSTSIGSGPGAVKLDVSDLTAMARLNLHIGR